MSRVEIATQAWGWVADASGNGLGGRTVQVKNLDTTAATHWSAITGGTSSTADLTTNSDGTIPRFIEEGTYTVTISAVTHRVEAAVGSGIVAVKANRPLNLRDEGADYLGSTDASTILTASLAAADHVDIPSGTYRLDTAITVGSGKTLDVDHRAIVKRLTAASSTGPIIVVTGVDARLVGRGTIQSEKTSPQGLVLIGPPTQTVTTTVDQWRLGPLKLIGRAAPTSADIGLNVWSSQAAGGDGGSGAGANYNGIADPGLWISNVGEGLRLGSLCNAHTFNAINFSQIANYCYRLMGGAGGVQECSFFGGFTHTSYAGANITIIKGERAMFNQFYGQQAEPLVGAGTVPWNLDANSTLNKIFAHFNLPGTHAGVDSGTFNFLMDQHFLKVPKLVVTTDSVNIKTKAGVPNDGDFYSPLVAGTLAWDDTAKKLYIKDVGGTWRSSAVFT